jgi:DNA (cytosine-5)-methyltransferase 1
VSEIDVDLFAGPGGFDEGRRIAGHDTVPLLGIEWEPQACRTAMAAGHFRVRADVSTFPIAHLAGRVRLLMASPPCPTFSSAGKGAGRVALDLFAWGITQTMAGRNVVGEVRRRHARMLRTQPLDHKRARLTRAQRSNAARADAVTSALVLEPARWIRDTQPEAVVLEQVPAVLPIWQALARELRTRGWSAWAGVLNAADHGVPQTRVRAILIASRTRRAAPPEPSHAEHPAEDLFGGHRLPWVSMAQALGWVGEGTDRDGTHGRVCPVAARVVNTRGNRTTPGGNEFPTDRPSWALTEKTRSWTLRVGTNAHAAERTEREPAPTLFFGGRLNGVEWVVRTGNNTMKHSRSGSKAGDGGVVPYERPVSEPAPTLDTATGNKWTLGRPATTVQGDPRIPEGTVRITIEEAGILQSFRPDYPWKGTRTSQFGQVGNAIPPLLAARCVAAVLGSAGALGRTA